MKSSRPVRSVLWTAGLVLAVLCLRDGTGAEPPADRKSTPEKTFSTTEVAFFEKQVQPLLQAHCLKCHGAEKKVRGGLRLTSRDAILKGGDLGPAASLTQSEESRLLQAINYRDGLEMPPKGKLPAVEIEVLTRWVKAGLPWTPGKADVVQHQETGGKVTPESRNYWAYRPLRRPPVPAVKHKEWVRSPLDAFLLARMEEKGLTPAGPADRVALVRRVSYDLTGLPPGPEAVDAFVNDRSPDAYEKLLDRLLASPQYGEKWGRHWLDLVRYAETNGYERDSAKPFAWRYRDYVIDSFNKDKPYDVFVREQIAGDELDQVTAETLTATGYYRLGIWDDEPADRLLARYDMLDGLVSTTGQAILGMTLNCARCHDHKKDPIPQRDYYRFLAFFRDVTDMNGRNTLKVATPRDRQEQERLVRQKQAREANLYGRLYRLEQQFILALAQKKGIKADHLPASDLVDLTYRFYRDTWEKLPEFDGLKHEAEGPIAGNRFTLAPASRQEAIGLVFQGKLKVPQAGEYAFTVDSTEGARLLIDGKAVVNRPQRGRQSETGKVTLAAGLVPIRLEYFNGYAKPSLRVKWSGPGVDGRLLSEDAEVREGRTLLADSRQKGQVWGYTIKDPGAGWTQPAFREEGWRKGIGGFGTRGTPGAVVRTRWDTDNIWLRKTFVLNELPQYLSLDLHHDDEVEIYLNGTLVYQADNYLVQYKRISLKTAGLKALKRGENIIAVHCHQRSGGQYIDAGLVEASDQADLADLVRRHGPEVLGPEQTASYLELGKELEASRKTKAEEAGLEVMCVEERGRGTTNVLIRGLPSAPSDRVEAGFPEVLTTTPTKIMAREPSAATSGKRRALAEWLTSPQNGVTARVMANRLWLYHFGRGIVPTPNDFGKLGEPATHPELLDWLAGELISGGWRLKRMHKLIMLSSAYQMSAHANDRALRVDPGNTLWWRFNMRRLAAEEVRDSILAVSGQLNLKAGGPSVYPLIPKEVLAGQSVPGSGWGKSMPEEATRRSVYVHVKRSLLVPILSAHDQADTDSSCPVRYTTTVPTQALGMLNGQFTNEQAGAFVERLRRETPGDLAGQVRRAIRLTTCRQPRDEEVQKDVAFVREMMTGGKRTEQDALRIYCLMALNTNEFIYLD